MWKKGDKEGRRLMIVFYGDYQVTVTDMAIMIAILAFVAIAQFF